MATSAHRPYLAHRELGMNPFLDKTIDIVGYGLMMLGTLALLTACPDDKSSEETGPASSLGDTSGKPSGGSETGDETQPGPESIDGGKWCSGCPQGSAGPLCCADKMCTPWDAAFPSTCPDDGVVGWCNNYTLSDEWHDPKSSLKIATCHDAL